MNSTTALELPRELASRVGDGLEVVLLWFKSTNHLIVSVTDRKTGDHFDLRPEAENALSVFYHPYAYAASTGTEYRVPRREPVSVDA